MKNLTQLTPPPCDYETHIFEQITVYEQRAQMTQAEKQFLSGLIRHYRPTKLLEVGVAHGSSSIVMLNAIADMPESSLTSIDIMENVWFDKTKKVGSLVDSVPHLKKNWHLYTDGTIADFSSTIGGAFDFCLLDTAHTLPGELLDFLLILPLMKPGGIVVIHDINFAVQGTKDQIACNLLYSLIVGNKLLPSKIGKALVYNIGKELVPNIGAIQITEDTKKYIDSIFHALLIPWHYFPSSHQILASSSFLATHYSPEKANEFLRIVEVQRYMRARHEKQHESQLQTQVNELKKQLHDVQESLHFPNGSQKFLLALYRPFFKLAAPPKYYNQLKNNPNNFFADTKHPVNKAFLKLLELFGPKAVRR